jgi:hypothetical protein
MGSESHKMSKRNIMIMNPVKFENLVIGQQKIWDWEMELLIGLLNDSQASEQNN